MTELRIVVSDTLAAELRERYALWRSIPHRPLTFGEMMGKILADAVCHKTEEEPL